MIIGSVVTPVTPNRIIGRPVKPFCIVNSCGTPQQNDARGERIHQGVRIAHKSLAIVLSGTPVRSWIDLMERVTDQTKHPPS
jgi:hypothetical protein